jgi:hypothetical protein
VTGEWKKLHNEELNDLYCSPNIVRVIKIEKNEMGGPCSAYGERRLAYRVLVGKSVNNRLFGRPRRRSKDSIKRCLADVGDMDWIGLAGCGLL